MNKLEEIKDSIINRFNVLNVFPNCFKIPCNKDNNVTIHYGLPSDNTSFDIKPNRFQLGGYLHWNEDNQPNQINEIVSVFIKSKFKTQEEYSTEGLHLVEDDIDVVVCYDPKAGGDIWVGISQCYGFGSPS